MDQELQRQVAFHLTGKRADSLHAVDARGLRPAVLAPYRDLTRLRYDFPLVLVREGPDDEFAQSLSGIIDRVLREIAPRGIEGERLRGHVLRLEREIRTAVAQGARGSLSELWELGARRLAAGAGESVGESLARARSALAADGEMVDCDETMPVRLLTHAWQRVQDRKARRFREETSRLVLRLTDILRADFVRSEAGCSPASLKAAVGTVHAPAFDFDAMSRLLAKVAAKDPLPESRCRRIRWAVSVLRSQRFFPGGNGATGGESARGYGFVFDNCAGALEAFRARLPEMIGLVKAIAVAELEVDSRYVESKHDAFFEHFDESALGARDLALFPDYLVCLRPGPENAADNARLMELLSSPLPVKVLVQSDDVVEESTLSDGHFAFGVRATQLASTVVGLGRVYVLQSCSSNLLQLRERIASGLAYPGSALFSVFCGPARYFGGLPPYLSAAAAMHSRALPAFSYDPAGGPDWASRFRLEDNPQTELDWPVQTFAYEDEERQRVTQELPFTFVDFAACDARYAAHFADIPPAQWNANMAPVSECLAREAHGLTDKVPYLLMVDEDNVLHRVIVDGKLIEAARRCHETWNKLQELGGVHNSYAERLLARERQAWEEQKRRELAALGAAPAPPAPGARAQAAPAAVMEKPAPAEVAPEERPADEPYIETPRCTSCDECTQINNKMFAYDANKQAYIADLGAGTYRQLVEAAEACQVSIIHPGKPRDPNEPGLAELVERAAAFS